jgi:hypothetical protein
MTTPTIVQARCNSSTSGGSLSYGGNVFQSAQTARHTNYCIVADSWTTAPQTVSVADTSNGSYILVAQFVDATNVTRISLFCRPNIVAAGAATNTLTVTYATTDNSFPDIVFFEVAGANPSNPVDAGVAHGSAASGTTASSGNFPARVLGELGIGYAYANPATGAGSGWTAVTAMTNGAGGGITNQEGIFESRTIATPTSLAATCGVGNDPWDIIGFGIPSPGTGDVMEFGSAA